MFQFLVKRFIGLVFVLLGVSIITFIIGRLAPGDPVVSLLGPHPTKIAIANIRHEYGLDQSWFQQYLNFIHDMLSGTMGRSFQSDSQTVADILGGGLPVSLELGLWGLLVQLFVGIPLGILAALRANRLPDTLSMGVALVLYAVPSFVLAGLFQVVIVALHGSIGLQWPVSGWGNAWQYSLQDIQFKLGPILIYAAVGVAYFARLTRTSTLEVLRQDYIRTARSKGLVERVVVFRHAMRNALIPIITVLGVTLGFLVSGAFFTETVFNIPGIAYYTVQSITTRDYPVIQATTVLLATAVVLGNLISDLLYTAVDPRIKSA